jgi:AraC-like DNA-binding protein
MHEDLRLPHGLDGWVWRYRFASYPLRVHHHAELELNLVTRGAARYLVDERRYELRPNTLIWLFPAQSHLLLDQSADYEMWIAVFRPRLVRRTCTATHTRVLRKAKPSRQFSRQLAERAARRLQMMFADLIEARDDAPRFNAGIAYALLTAWSSYVGGAESGGGSFDLHPAVERAARLIRDELDHTRSLDELAEQSGLSPSRLSRLFKRQAGVSLVRYRQRVQLERFLQLYERMPQRNRMQTALAAGFGSYPQFHRVFKALMGYAPGEHRPGRARELS